MFSESTFPVLSVREERDSFNFSKDGGSVISNFFMHFSTNSTSWLFFIAWDLMHSPLDFGAPSPLWKITPTKIKVKDAVLEIMLIFFSSEFV